MPAEMVEVNHGFDCGLQEATSYLALIAIDFQIFEDGPLRRSQLLHLSARTRCRWSLRFQVSYLTLLFRRTNRFGPVDFAGLTNPVEVFQDDPLIVRFCVSHDLLADAVVGGRDKTPLTTRDTLERLFGALATVGLERSSRPFVVSFFVADILRRVELVV